MLYWYCTCRVCWCFTGTAVPVERADGRGSLPVDPGTDGGEDQAPDPQDDPAQQEPRQAEDSQGWVQLWAQEIMITRKGYERRRRITVYVVLKWTMDQLGKRVVMRGEEALLGMPAPTPFYSRARICTYTFKEPRNALWGIDYASLCSLSYRYDK